MGLRADSACPQRVSGSARIDSCRAESARNPIALHVKFGDDCANAQPGLSQWTAAGQRWSRGTFFRGTDTVRSAVVPWDRHCPASSGPVGQTLSGQSWPNQCFRCRHWQVAATLPFPHFELIGVRLCEANAHNTYSLSPPKKTLLKRFPKFLSIRNLYGTSAHYILTISHFFCYCYILDCLEIAKCLQWSFS